MEMQASGWEAPLLSLGPGLVGRRQSRVRLAHKLGPFQVRLERTSNICATRCGSLHFRNGRNTRPNGRESSGALPSNRQGERTKSEEDISLHR